MRVFDLYKSTVRFELYWRSAREQWPTVYRQAELCCRPRLPGTLRKIIQPFSKSLAIAAVYNAAYFTCGLTLWIHVERPAAVLAYHRIFTLVTQFTSRLQRTATFILPT